MAAILINCQFRETGKSKNLRRFTIKEKLLSLSLYKQSPRSYSFLSTFFVLPSKTTLSRLLEQVVGGPGIHKVIFESLQEIVGKMDESDKFVAVLFDEMAIMPGLHFNEHLGLIEGFEDMGDGRREDHIADHALVFMVRGIKKPWKAPLSFHLASRGGAKTPQVKNILRQVVTELILIDLKPVTVICDQKNSAVLNQLMEETKQNYLRNNNGNYREGSFEVEQCQIYPIYDPPHLIKGMRNNLIKKNLTYMKENTTKTAKWEHIKKLYEFDGLASDGLKVLPHLNDEHIYEKKMKKMKVRSAAQIFSQRVAATLQLVSRLDSQQVIGSNAEDTAALLSFFDRLFDSFNGSNKNSDHGKILRCGLSETSDHLRFWKEEALPLLSTMRFQKISDRELAIPPSLKHWTFNIKNIKAIWNMLKVNGFQYPLPRRLNQDPLENAFGQLRSFGALNSHPSSAQFVGIFKTLFFNTTMSFYKRTFNCENDTCENMFSSLGKLFNNSVPPAENVNKYVSLQLNRPDDMTLSATLQQLSANYISGFILKKIKKYIKCSNCHSSLYSTGTTASHALISAREYGGDIARRLQYPTPAFAFAFDWIIKIIYAFLNKEPYSSFLSQEIGSYIKQTVQFDFISCEKEHVSDLINSIIKFSIRTILHSWCRNVNRILSGKAQYSEKNCVKLQASKIYKNRLKKQKIKKPQHIVSGTV